MPEGTIQGRRTGFFVRGEGPDLRPVEYETFSCGHCQHVTHVAHGSTLFDLGSFDRRCMRPLCKKCTAEMAQGAECKPFEKRHEEQAKLFHTDLEQRINAQLERDRFLHQLEFERRA